MLDERYLTLGLNALSRAYTTNYFADGHKGAAIISAYYLCEENPVAEGVAPTIADIVDEHWTHTELCAPFPDEPADAALLERITAALFDNIGQFRQVGHNVIFPSLALKAFRDVPRAVTPSRVEGICKLIESFDTAEDITLDETDEFPEFYPPERMAEFILSETLRTIDAFLGRGQGWSGHMLTYGRALIDLHQLGYVELAAAGHHAFRLYVKRTRMGPLERDLPRDEHPPSKLLPLEYEYWRKRGRQDIGIGHCFKYPYGFFGLIWLAGNAALEQRCMEEAYHVL